MLAGCACTTHLPYLFSVIVDAEFRVDASVGRGLEDFVCFAFPDRLPVPNGEGAVVNVAVVEGDE